LNFAKQNNADFKFHNLIWANIGRSPQWIENLNNPAHLEQFMYTYIDKVIDRYGNNIKYLDVVNEAISD
jgi:GH35 family endo-1,4-beta-xylanase